MRKKEEGYFDIFRFDKAYMIDSIDFFIFEMQNEWRKFYGDG
jgi:hypothetical protein